MLLDSVVISLLDITRELVHCILAQKEYHKPTDHLPE